MVLARAIDGSRYSLTTWLGLGLELGLELGLGLGLGLFLEHLVEMLRLRVVGSGLGPGLG